MLHVLTQTLTLRYQCCGRAYAFPLRQPCMKWQYWYKEARIRTIAVSEPVGGGGPAQGSQLKNLKSHKASLNGEATLYNTNTLESLTASFSTKTEVEVSSDSVAPTYHQRTNNFGLPHNIWIWQEGKGYGRTQVSSKVIGTCETEIINEMRWQQTVKSMCFQSVITVILKIQQWEQVQKSHIYRQTWWSTFCGNYWFAALDQRIHWQGCL